MNDDDHKIYSSKIWHFYNNRLQYYTEINNYLCQQGNLLQKVYCNHTYISCVNNESSRVLQERCVLTANDYLVLTDETIQNMKMNREKDCVKHTYIRKCAKVHYCLWWVRISDDCIYTFHHTDSYWFVLDWLSSLLFSTL